MSPKEIRLNSGIELSYLLDDPEARLTYKNPEGYADPTCFFALCNVMREEKKKQNRPRDKPEYQRNKPRKKRFNTQVIHYDERGNEI